MLVSTGTFSSADSSRTECALARAEAGEETARAAISDDAQNSVFVSAASAWEIATKYRIGKLSDARVVAEDISDAVAAEGFDALAASVLHAERAGSLVGHHRDPFDRMSIAQAISEGLVLLSNEPAFEAYGVKRLW